MAGTTTKQESLLLAYMVGWRKGAGGHALTEREQANHDFMQGWNDGRAAVKTAYGLASTHYGCVLNVLRLAESKGDPQ